MLINISCSVYTLTNLKQSAVLWKPVRYRQVP